VYTRIVGQQHQDADQQPPCVGEELLLLREPNNAVDPCAILVRAQLCCPPAAACNLLACHNPYCCNNTMPAAAPMRMYLAEHY
jgi:hypothetical protein